MKRSFVPSLGGGRVRWVRASGWIPPMTERLRPLLEAAAQDYVSRDPAWPKRTEPCDKSS